MKQPWQQQQQQRRMAGYAWQQKRKAAGEVPERRGCVARVGQVIVILLFIGICALIVYVALNFQGPSF